MDEELERRLALIPPERRRTVVERIGILEAFAGLPRPTITDADRAAAGIGMNRTSFYRLFNAWMAFRDPAVVGSVGGSRGPSGRRSLPGDDFVRSTFAGLPRGRPLQRDVAAIETAAHEQGVAIRSRSSLQAMVRDLRAEPGRVAERPEADLFVDHAAVEIPVAGAHGPVWPVASVLGRRSSATVLAVVLRLQPLDAGTLAEVLRHALDTGALVASDDGPSRLAAEFGFGRAWDRVGVVLREHGIIRVGQERRRPAGGRTGGELMYPRLLGFRSHTAVVNRPEERRPARVRAVLDEVLALDAAQAAVDARIAAFGVGAPAAICADPERLVRRLEDAG